MADKRMNVCFIVQNYFYQDPRVRKYANLLLGHNHQVDIICLRNKYLQRKEKNKYFNIYQIGLSKKRGNRLRYLLEYIVFFIEAFFLVNFLGL